MTQAKLAKFLGVSQPRVSKLTKRDGWRWGKAPWTKKEADEIKAWHATLKADESETGVDEGEDLESALKKLPLEKQIKLGATLERKLRQQTERTLLLGGFLKKDEVERGRIERIAAVKQELMNIRLLALKLQGKDVIHMEPILEEWARGVCRKFSQSE